MQYLDHYNIHFKGLSDGLHVFRFELDEEFFARFEESEIRKGNIIALLGMEKKPSILIMDFALDGSVNIRCDRCLDLFDLHLSCTNRVYVKQTHEKDGDDDVIFIDPEEHQFNVAQLLYEFAHLALPYRRIHPENKQGKSLCNKEMLAKLAEFSGKSPGDGKDVDSADPRWDELKKIKRTN